MDTSQIQLEDYDFNRKYLDIFIELLIPESSSSVNSLSLLGSKFDEDGMEPFRHLLDTLATVPADARIETVTAFERDHPTLFAALYERLLTAYYSAPATQARIRALADAGPREPSPHFDPALVAEVVAHQRGKRRL
jgi:hypothetical protein